MRHAACAGLLVLLLCLTLAPGARAGARTGGIEGTVTHEGTAVAGAWVSVDGRTVSTDASGRFSFPQSASRATTGSSR